MRVGPRRIGRGDGAQDIRRPGTRHRPDCARPADAAPGTALLARLGPPTPAPRLPPTPRPARLTSRPRLARAARRRPARPYRPPCPADRTPGLSPLRAARHRAHAAGWCPRGPHLPRPCPWPARRDHRSGAVQARTGDHHAPGGLGGRRRPARDQPVRQQLPRPVQPPRGGRGRRRRPAHPRVRPVERALHLRHPGHPHRSSSPGSAPSSAPRPRSSTRPASTRTAASSSRCSARRTRSSPTP